MHNLLLEIYLLLENGILTHDLDLSPVTTLLFTHEKKLQTIVRMLQQHACNIFLLFYSPFYIMKGTVNICQ